jgi:hypothetical protein
MATRYVGFMFSIISKYIEMAKNSITYQFWPGHAVEPEI